MSVLHEALAYARRGIRVIPIKPGEKRPTLSGWTEAATNDPATITRWYTGQFKDCGLGIATGQTNDRYLIVLDIDDREQFAGSETLADLEEAHGKLPDSVRATTGTGGKHIYLFTDQPIHNEASGTLGVGIDIRGVGGQVLAPPTIHPNGKPYEWDGPSIAEKKPDDMPLWMVLLLTEKQTANIPTQTDHIPQTNLTEHGILDPEEGPASRYCAATTWPQLLQADGWTLAHTDHKGEQHWVRPGKDLREGTSATTGWQGKDILVVFTTSIPNLPPGAYNRFGYTAAVHHGNDRSAFAKKLLQQGNTYQPVEQPGILDNVLINWTDFWSQTFPTEDWLIEPVIPRNQLVTIFAPGGTGKSLFSLYLAAGIATERELFGNTQPATHVLYMDYEMTQAVLHERLTNMGFDKHSDLTHLHYASLPPIHALDTPDGSKLICDLARRCQAKFVIIDTFARAVDGAENEADTVRNFYRWTAINLKAEGRSLLRIDHAGKDLTKGARGTSAKNDDVDLVWQMTKVDGQLVLVRQKHRHVWIPERVTFTIHDGPHMFTEDVKGGERLEQAHKMLDELGIDPTLSLDAAYDLVKDKAGPIYRVNRKTVRAAQKQRQQRHEQTLDIGQIGDGGNL